MKTIAIAALLIGVAACTRGDSEADKASSGPLPPATELDCAGEKFISSSVTDYGAAPLAPPVNEPDEALRDFVHESAPGLAEEVPTDVENRAQTDDGFSYRRDTETAGRAEYRDGGRLLATFRVEHHGDAWSVSSHEMCDSLSSPDGPQPSITESGSPRETTGSSASRSSVAG
jgi:hypothetical protein